ncbi:MAG: hypothetical protein WKF65_13970 [Gaiellaceae bacterium]
MRERRVDRYDPLPPALRLPHVQEPSREVDVVPGKPEQLAPAQAGVGEEGKQEPVAFGPAAEVPLPDVPAVRRGEQPLELRHRQHVRECFPFHRRPQRPNRVTLELLVVDEEAEERLQRRRRPRLTRGRRLALRVLGQEGAQVRRPHLGFFYGYRDVVSQFVQIAAPLSPWSRLRGARSSRALR